MTAAGSTACADPRVLLATDIMVICAAVFFVLAARGSKPQDDAAAGRHGPLTTACSRTWKPQIQAHTAACHLGPSR